MPTFTQIITKREVIEAIRESEELIELHETAKKVLYTQSGIPPVVHETVSRTIDNLINLRRALLATSGVLFDDDEQLIKYELI